MPEETPLLVITTHHGQLLTHDVTNDRVFANSMAAGCGKDANMRAVVMPVQTVLDMWAEIVPLAQVHVGCICYLGPPGFRCPMCRIKSIVDTVHDTGANPTLTPSTTHA